MAQLVERHPEIRAPVRTTTVAPWYQAFRILQFAFIAAPTIAGLDKFFHLLVNWDRYLAPPVARMLPMSASLFMMIVGVIEIAAGFLVAIKPRIGAPIVALWLVGIILNLVLTGQYWDIALRDFGLMLGALALWRLASEQEVVTKRSTPTTTTTVVP
jgi:hypothetical protein